MKLVLTAIALVATAVVAIAALSSGSSPDITTLKPSETDLTSCAAHFAAGSASRKDGSAGGDLLVPADPEKALICRYYGFPQSVPTGGDTEGRSEKLAAEAHLASSRAARSYAGAFDELEAIAPGEYTCPEDDGAAAYVLFAYPDAPTVRVLVGLSGCEFVGSNATAHGFHLSPALSHRLSMRR